MLYIQGNDTRKMFTFGRLANEPTKGVPSRLSFVDDLVLLEDRDSSRGCRTRLRSAYFRHASPQLSQRILEDSPLGAFHQAVDSRILQAPQVGIFEAGSATIEVSSSESPTRCPFEASSSSRY